MKWLGSFILACFALATAFLAVFDGSVAAVFNFGSKSLEVATQLNQASRNPPSLEQTQAALIDLEPRVRSVQFYVSDELGDGQLSEPLKVYMGSPPTLVGEFNLTPTQSRGDLSIRGESGPGLYEYSLASTMVTRTEDGVQRIACSGSGSVRVRESSRFAAHLISYNPRTKLCRIGLQ